MYDEKKVNLFMKTFSNLRTVGCKGIDKQKDKSSRINFIFL